MADGRRTVLITGQAYHPKTLDPSKDPSSISELSDIGIETLSLEVHKPSSISALKDSIEKRTSGTLDILINNAGRNYTIPALDVDFDEVQDLFEVNVFSVMRMCQTFSPLLIRAKGMVVQIGSLSGFMPHVFGSPYNASKAALHSYSNTLRVELAPLGVRVVLAYTGGVQSRISRVERELPSNSLYWPANEGYIKRMTHSQQNAMDADTYAKSVVPQLLQKTPRHWIWEGSYVWLMWFFWTFMPKTFLDGMFTKMFMLDKVSGSQAAVKHF
ncbi:NADPH-dependent 1-acyl dihydroxyacetone phosphate reductase [Lecanora helva]